ncbi:RadC family protein [Wolbachia endosymbiont of Rhagoletis cingulata]
MNNKKSSRDRREEIEFRALESNGKALLDREVIETFLSAVHDREEARVIARKLMDNFGIGGILGQEIDDLKTIEGITDSTVAVILCLKEAAKRVPREELKKGPVMDNLETIVKYLRVSIGYSEEEKMKIIYFDQKCRLKGEEVFTGTVDKVPFYIREVTRKALIRKATSIIISHNHPEGRLKPSDEDEAVTKDLAKACQTIGIRLLDHIIITSVGYFSFKEQGLL